MAVKKDNFLSDLGTQAEKSHGFSITDGFRLGLLGEYSSSFITRKYN
jgi:hypothetical protein